MPREYENVTWACRLAGRIPARTEGIGQWVTKPLGVKKDHDSLDAGAAGFLSLTEREWRWSDASRLFQKIGRVFTFQFSEI